MAKKKVIRENVPLQTDGKMTQQKRDRIASILAITLGLLSIREGGAVLLGATIPDYHVLLWLVWYNVIMVSFPSLPEQACGSSRTGA